MSLFVWRLQGLFSGVEFAISVAEARPTPKRLK